MGNELIEQIARAVRAHGLAAVARKLGIPRQSLASVLVGACREGTRALAVSRWQERSDQGSRIGDLRGPGVRFGE